MDAIHKIAEAVKECKRNGDHLLVIALNLKNAFNTASVPAIKRPCLETDRLPDNLRNICGNFLDEKVFCVWENIETFNERVSTGVQPRSVTVANGDGGLVRMNEECKGPVFRP